MTRAITESEALRAVRRALRWLRKAEKSLVRIERQQRQAAKPKKQDAKRYGEFMQAAKLAKAGEDE